MARIAMPLDRDFEDSEFTVPCERLVDAGHEVLVVGTKRGAEVHGKKGKATATIDATARELDVQSFDALVIPGGYSPDHLRLDADVVSFVRCFFATGRPVAAICHAPQLLIEADVLRGKTLTSWPSVRKDIENAGGCWVDREVVEDGNLITSRKPADLDAFCDAILSHVGAAQRYTPVGAES
jgi:protease I